ncbi:MAG: hypothetical protein F4Z65_08650 [Acidobacteria bacterium]|nr:hypothetical protein [Acidobacteriota bacterium]MYA46458.1 hypothetical protein [Acidobacteriota bacterium]MYI38303.1 hypothetical protein [Acidobacteriota bacterium]
MGLSFSQRFGYSPVPQRLTLEELPENARVAIWNVLIREISTDIPRRIGPLSMPSSWVGILVSVHEEVFNEKYNTFNFDHTVQRIDGVIQADTFWVVFDLVQFILRHPSCPAHLVEAMADCFAAKQLAYSIECATEPTIVPAASEAEGHAISDAFQTLRDAGLRSATKHLEEASQLINRADYSGSIRESIHAVESVAKPLARTSSNSLGPALKALEKDGTLHPALKGGFLNLYGYTSDEQGIRHALLDGNDAAVGPEEAVFMLSACAAFAGFLARKAKRTR